MAQFWLTLPKPSDLLSIIQSGHVQERSSRSAVCQPASWGLPNSGTPSRSPYNNDHSSLGLFFGRAPIYGSSACSEEGLGRDIWRRTQKLDQGPNRRHHRQKPKTVISRMDRVSLFYGECMMVLPKVLNVLIQNPCALCLRRRSHEHMSARLRVKG